MKIFKSIFKFLFFSFVTLVFYEVFFGLTEISEPAHYIIDDRLGYILKPSEPVLSIEEGLFIGQSNEYGYWGYGYPLHRTPNSVRFAMIGDSHVAGLQLPAKFHFRTIFEKKLQQLINKKVEVLNFGRSGHHLDRMLIQYYEDIQNYKPDYLLVFLTPADFLTREEEIGPEFYLENDSLKVNYNFTRSTQYSFLKSIEFSRDYNLYSLVQKCWVLFRNGETNKILFDKFYSIFKSSNDNKSNNSDNEDNYFEVNKAILKTFGQLNNSSTRIVLVIREELPEKYNKVINHHHLPVINLYSYLEKLKKEGYSINYWKATNQYGHWNHLAQVFIGEYLADAFQRKLQSYEYSSALQK